MFLFLGCLVSSVLKILYLFLYAIFKVRKRCRSFQIQHYTEYLDSLSDIELKCHNQEVSLLGRIFMEMEGFEPLTPCLQGRCSPN